MLSKNDVLRHICRGALDYVYPDGPIREDCIIKAFPEDADQVPVVCKVLEQEGYIFMATEMVSESWPDVTGWKLTVKGFQTEEFEKALQEAAEDYAVMTGVSVQATKAMICPNRLIAAMEGGRDK